MLDYIFSSSYYKRSFLEFFVIIFCYFRGVKFLETSKVTAKQKTELVTNNHLKEEQKTYLHIRLDLRYFMLD